MTSIHESMARAGFVRPLDSRILGGVCVGVGRRFGLDPWPTRLLFLLLLIVLPGSPLLIYPVLWIIMPSEQWRPSGHPEAPQAGYPQPPVPPAGA